MTLLLAVFAAVAVTVLWYNRKSDHMHLGILCCMFWGASVMWLVDAIFEYLELGAEYFQPALEDMINDSFLGFSVIALALVVWLFFVLVKDTKGSVRASITRKKM